MQAKNNKSQGYKDRIKMKVYPQWIIVNGRRTPVMRYFKPKMRLSEKMYEDFNIYY